MRHSLVLTLAFAAMLAGCTSRDESSRHARGSASDDAAQAATARKTGDQFPARRAIASLPDRGELLRYASPPALASNGRAALVPVALSEEHAFNAIHRKELVLDAPDGERIAVKYARHEDHGDGNWTWIGRAANGGSALLTFGQDAVFGSVQRPDGSELRITTQHRRTYAVVVRPDQLRGVETSTGSDFLLAPDHVAQVATRRSAASRSEQSAAGAAPTAAAAAAANEVDVLLGYSTGLAQRIGSASGAETRMQSLVAISNEGYQNSGVVYRVRLVGTVQVAYGDNTRNDTALHALTGSTGTGSAPIDPAFNALRAAREQTGADMVSFVRQFREPDQDGCGIAWLLGGQQSTIDQSDAPFAYSVVSDGSDLNESDNRTYFCREETLAHELGHTMGQTHNSEDSTSAGAHAYSYGYREASTSGFYTIMAYRISDSSQVSIRYFANPNVAFAGRATGVANQSDNARSMNLTMPILAGFRNSVNATPQMDLFAIGKQGGSGRTEVHVMSRRTGFQSYALNYATALHQTGSDYRWRFMVADFNSDGYPDLFSINRVGASGRTEAHILSGGTRYQTFLLNVATALHATGTANDWIFRVGDYNSDGRPDLYVIARNGSSGRTEVHVLNGATNYSNFLAHIATALHSTGSSGAWSFGLGDYNRDGRLDLYAIAKQNTGSGRTEVHVLNGAANFGGFLLNTASALHPTGSDDSWAFDVADYDGDGIPDVYAIAKQGSSGKTEVHVLRGSTNYTSFAANLATILHGTGSDNAWEFALAPYL